MNDPTTPTAGYRSIGGPTTPWAGAAEIMAARERERPRFYAAAVGYGSELNRWSVWDRRGRSMDGAPLKVSGPLTRSEAERMADAENRGGSIRIYR
jgi:hypothetical protein